jgi:hypothetical protein
MSEVAERLLADLDDEQRIVATTVRGPVLVIAGAGTGKTRAITYRIAYGVASGAFDPMKTLALTFTDIPLCSAKAADLFLARGIWREISSAAHVKGGLTQRSKRKDRI